MLSGGYCLGLFRDCKQIVGDCFDYLGTLKIGPEEWQVSFLVIGVFCYRSFFERAKSLYSRCSRFF